VAYLLGIVRGLLRGVFAGRRHSGDEILNCRPDCSPRCNPELGGCNPDCRPSSQPCVPDACSPQCSPNTQPCNPYNCTPTCAPPACRPEQSNSYGSLTDSEAGCRPTCDPNCAPATTGGDDCRPDRTCAPLTLPPSSVIGARGGMPGLESDPCVPDPCTPNTSCSPDICDPGSPRCEPFKSREALGGALVVLSMLEDDAPGMDCAPLSCNPTCMPGVPPPSCNPVPCGPNTGCSPTGSPCAPEMPPDPFPYTAGDTDAHIATSAQIADRNSGQ
jgi:hypothetical protein